MSALFISDLHLQPEHPEVVEAFFRFIKEQASQAEALYILGDFFEAWIGDDLENEFINHIKDALKSLSGKGVSIYLMHGNRDFLIGSTFAEQTGCQLLDDPCVIDLFGQKALLMHGDTLCTRDVDYLAFRQMVRNPQWQTEFIAKPLAERLAIAEQLRQVSKQKTGEKQYAIMDVTPKEVEKVMSALDVRLLIHGHTHRPAVHQLTIDNAAAERVVLGDWHNAGWVLKVDAQGYSLQDFPL